MICDPLAPRTIFLIDMYTRVTAARWKLLDTSQAPTAVQK